MNKKRLYTIVGASVAMVVLLVILVLSRAKTRVVPLGDGGLTPYEPEFMNEVEKSAFELPADSKIQVLKRGDSGTIEVYKIIREDADIVNNLEEIK